MFYRGRTEIIMCESTAYQYRRDSTYTVPYVPTIAFCANARPRTLGTLPDDASRLMRGVPTQRLVGLRPTPCVVPPRKPVGFRQRTETRKPPSWHTKAHEISRSDKLQSKICGKYFAMTTLRRYIATHRRRKQQSPANAGPWWTAWGQSPMAFDQRGLTPSVLSTP